jgi:excisionase family DNA binding protein
MNAAKPQEAGAKKRCARSPVTFMAQSGLLAAAQDALVAPYIKPVEVARFLDCHINTVYRLIQSPDFPKVRIRRSYRIPRQAFMEYLAKKNAPAVNRHTKASRCRHCGGAAR